MVYIVKFKISTIFKLLKFSLREGLYMERGYVKVNFFYFGFNFFFLWSIFINLLFIRW